jgi:hypothetical protein
MKNTEKVKAFENSGMISHLTMIYKNIGDRLNALYNAYKEQKALKPLENTSELRNLTGNPDSFIKRQYMDLVGSVPSYAGIQMKQEKFIETLDLPDFSKIINCVTTFHEYLEIREVKPYTQHADVLGCFILQGDKIVLNQDELERRLDPFRIFAITGTQQKVFAALNTLVNAYRDLDTLLRKETKMAEGIKSQPHNFYTTDHTGIVTNQTFYENILF